MEGQMADGKKGLRHEGRVQIVEGFINCDKEFGFSPKVNEMPLEGFIQERDMINSVFLYDPSGHKVRKHQRG